MRFRAVLQGVFLVSLVLFSSTAGAVTRQDVMSALNTLQSRCESGVNFDAFSTALDETQGQLGEFFDSSESAKYPDFAEAVERALTAYQTGFVIWKSKLEHRQDMVSLDHPTIQMMIAVYPEASRLFGGSDQASARDLIAFFWDKADVRIAEAKKMMSIRGKK